MEGHSRAGEAQCGTEEAHNEPGRLFRPAVEESHYFDKDADPDSHQSEKSDADPHQSEKSDPDQHQGDEDHEHSDKEGKLYYFNLGIS
jgi:hypothetical protein